MRTLVRRPICRVVDCLNAEVFVQSEAYSEDGQPIFTYCRGICPINSEEFRPVLTMLAKKDLLSRFLYSSSVNGKASIKLL